MVDHDQCTGQWCAHAHETDVAGNVSAASSALSVTIDTLAPAAPGSLTLAPTSDSGVPGDGITNKNTPVITGTGVAGDTITLRDGATAVGTATVGADGKWSITTSVLADGTRTLTATEADPAGNTSAASAALPVTIDSVAPAAPGNLALAAASDSGVVGDGITNKNPVITGTGVAGDTITLLLGLSVVGTTTVGSDGTWSFTTGGLTNGTHTFTAKETDVAGNVSAASAGLSVTIDRTAPTAPGNLALAPASDSGVKGDGITNINTPTITGTGIAGDTITLINQTDGTPVGTGLVGADGTWSITASALANGPHTLTATETDVAGNVSGASTVLPVTIDTLAPAAPGNLTLTPATDSGASAGDGITNNNTPVITGTGVAGDTITLRDGATAVGTATVAANGSWSITTSTLADGLHTLTPIESDLAGNTSVASAALAVTIDTVALSPGNLVLAPASDSGVLGDGITNKNPVITGTGVAGDTITLRNGATAVGTATVGADGNWSITLGGLADGAYTFSAIETDPAGNTSPSAALSVTVDRVAVPPGNLTLAPASDGGVKGDGLTNINTPVITGTGAAGDTITLFDGVTSVGTAVVGADGTWSITSGLLSDGTHSLGATETDVAGNVSAPTAGLMVKIDTANPLPTIALAPNSDSGLAGDGITNHTRPTLTGTAKPGSSVTITDMSTGSPIVISTVVADASGNWSYTPGFPIADGIYNITATSTDTAGNAASSSLLPLAIDTVAPAAPGSLTLDPASDSAVKGDGTTNVATPVIHGTGTAGDTITLLDGPAVVGTATVGADGMWSLTTSHLADGTHNLTAKQSDAAGNASPTSSSLALTISTAGPAAPANLTLDAASDSGAKGDNITNAATPLIHGTGTAGDTITLLDGADVVGTTTVAADGTWSLTTSHLADGTHNLTATQTDAVGNTSAASGTLALTIESTTPAAPAGLALGAASDSGAKGDNITNVVAPVITGTGAAGDKVTLFDGALAIGTATVGADGTWSLTTSHLSDGTHNLTATQADAAGNTSASSSPLALIINSTGPAAPAGLLLDPASDSGAKGDGITNIANPVIDGTGTAGDKIILSDDGTIIGTATVGADGKWSLTTSHLADGTHHLTATQSDAAGNTSPASDGLSLILDTIAPVVTASLQSPGAGSLEILAGTGDPNGTINIFDNNVSVATVTADASGQWHFDPSGLLAGSHSLVASETDAAGKSAPRRPCPSSSRIDSICRIRRLLSRLRGTATTSLEPMAKRMRNSSMTERITSPSSPKWTMS